LIDRNLIGLVCQAGMALGITFTGILISLPAVGQVLIQLLFLSQKVLTSIILRDKKTTKSPRTDTNETAI